MYGHIDRLCWNPSAPGQPVTVTVRCSPTIADQASTSLCIAHNPTNQTTPTNISLSRTGMNVPVISVTPASYGYYGKLSGGPVIVNLRDMKVRAPVSHPLRKKTRPE